MVCLSLELVGPCVVLGFSVSMEAFDELLSINVPWSQEFPGVRDWHCTPFSFSVEAERCVIGVQSRLRGPV